MRPRLTSLITHFRAFADSEWQDRASMRWAAQLLVGGLPGILICLFIMRMASSPAPDQDAGTRIASIIPLLSSSGLADTNAFHRLAFTPDPLADKSMLFRIPDASTAPTVAKHAAPTPARVTLSPDSGTPRTTWKHLTAPVRAAIDASLIKRQDWQQVVLHGSGVHYGNARLLSRYDSTIRGLHEGLAYHFVIGNGSGAADGQVEAGERWLKAQPSGAGAGAPQEEASISVCLMGDFSSQSPSPAQLEAVHELMDYLAIKLGALPLTTHQGSRCLGTQFDVGEVMKR